MATRSILDFNVIQPGHESNGAEPTLRMLIHRYYGEHFTGQSASRYVEEYIRQIETYAAKSTST